MYKKIRIPNNKLEIYNNKSYGGQCHGFTRDEHRAIMEQHLKRKLNRYEVVDHINGNKKDNRLENLRVMSLSEHSRKHMLDIVKDKSIQKKRIDNIRKSLVSHRLPHTENEFTCSHCKQLKHRSSFWKRKERWNGLRSVCKSCDKKYIK